MSALAEKARPGEERYQGASLDGAARTKRPGTSWNNSDGKSRGAIAGNLHAGQSTNFHAPRLRNFQGDLRGKFRGESTHAPAFDIDTNRWNKLSAEALNEHAETERLSAKEMAIKIGCNDRTLENYLQGRTAPSGVNFLRCLATIPEFRSRVDELCALERDCDPDAEKLRVELVRAAQKYADARARRNSSALPPNSTGDDSNAVAGELFEEVG